MRILIKKEYTEKNKNGEVKIINTIEKDKDTIIFSCKFGNFSYKITFYSDFILYEALSKKTTINYNDVYTLGSSLNGFKARDTSGKIIRNICPIDDEVFGILINELSIYTPLDINKILKKKKSDDKYKKIVTGKLALLIGIIIEIIFCIIIPDFGFPVAMLIGLLYFAYLVNKAIEKSKKNRLEKNIKSNPVYIVSEKIYHFAPNQDNYLSKLLSDVSARVITNNGTPFEAHAIKDEVEKRKKEVITNIVAKTRGEVIGYFNQLISQKVRPEVIGKILIKNFNENYSLNEDFQKRISLKIDTCIEKEFNNIYFSCINNLRTSQKNCSDFYTNRYINSEKPQGLGFGVITNSTSQALLYQAMDNHEREKQAKLQRMTYENNVVQSTGEYVMDKLDEVNKIYTNFCSEMLKTLNLIFDNIVDNKSSNENDLLKKFAINEDLKKIEEHDAKILENVNINQKIDREEIYNTAVKIDRDSISLEELKIVKKTLIFLGDYKEAGENVKIIDDKIKMLEQKKHNAIKRIKRCLLIGCIIVIIIAIISKLAIEITKKQNLYNQAMIFYEKEEYSEAIKILENISNYKDSRQKIDEITKKQEEIINEEIEKSYNEAKELMNVNEYEKALSILETITEYNDSQKLIEECSFFNAINNFITNEDYDYFVKKIKNNEYNQLTSEEIQNMIKGKWNSHYDAINVNTTSPTFNNPTYVETFLENGNHSTTAKSHTYPIDKWSIANDLLYIDVQSKNGNLGRYIYKVYDIGKGYYILAGALYTGSNVEQTYINKVYDYKLMWKNN